MSSTNTIDPNLKFFLVFYKDNGNREDCSVYYSWLTQAATRQAAIQKVAVKESADPADLDAEIMKLVT